MTTTVRAVEFMRDAIGSRVALLYDHGRILGTLVHVGECPGDDHDAVLVVERDDGERGRLHLTAVGRVKFHNPDSTRKDRRK